MTKLRATLCLLALLPAPAAGCSDGGDGGEGSGAAPRPTATDAAFVADMVPHHRSAVEMAELARERAEHGELRELAGEMAAAQRAEIEKLRTVGRELGDAHRGSHLSGDERDRGLHMDPGDLRDARPFDREFLDAMIEHHEGAVRMAREELAKGRHPELRELADDIVATQQREIATMREWRTRWYGPPHGQQPGHH